jgi:glucose-1-phosphate adenylyltransferase
MENQEWYQGTADAVRQNLNLLEHDPSDLILILSGDQLYRMNFQEMIRTHLVSKADVTIAALPVDEFQARSLGVMHIDRGGQVTSFEEKPKTPDALARMRVVPEWIDQQGIRSNGRNYLASMGIYLFSRKTLVEMLTSDNATDFGREIFPAAIAKRRVQAHLFDGYWEDIGTVGAFHQANIDLTKPNPPFDFVFEGNPVFTRPRYLPCSRLEKVEINNSLISDGCVIGKGCVIENSIIGVRAVIGDNVTIRNSYVMGYDDYETTAESNAAIASGTPKKGIGEGSLIENAIIDKNPRIGRNVRIVNAAGIVESSVESPTHTISDKIVVIPRGAVVKDGTEI